MSDCLLLNADYRPHSLLSWKEAITMLLQNKARVVEEYEDWEVRSPSITVKVPSVLVLMKYVVFRKKPVFNRANIYARDNQTCFGAGTRVLMSDGSFKMIENVEKGDKVIDAFGSPQNVIATGSRYVENAYELKCRRSWKRTVVTPDHEFLTSDRNFVPISNISEYTVFPRNIDLEKHRPSTVDLAEWVSTHEDTDWLRLKNGRIYWTRRSHEKGFPTSVSSSPDFAYWLGVYCAEGHSSKSDVSFTLHENEKDTIANRILEIGDDIWGLDGSLYTYEDSKRVRVNYSHKMLGMFMREFVGTHAWTKSIPWALVGPYHKDFLRGLFHGDCHYDQSNGKITLSLTSHKLIFESLGMLWGLGIFPTLQALDRDGKKPYWSIILQGESYHRFLGVVYDEDVEFSGRRIYGDDEFIYRKIKEFEPLEDEVKVYNLEVEGSKSYIADGYAVHNCQYCGARAGKKESLSFRDLTFDHVIPRAQGGGTNWKNIVTACKDCNHRKGDRTPKEAGMSLRRKPKRPSSVTNIELKLSSNSVPDAWKSYLYWTTEIEQD